MGDVVFSLICGLAFILAGRWVYAHPMALLKSSLYTHTRRELPLAKLWARLFATLLIFGGSFMVVAGLAGLVVRQAAPVTLLSVAAGVLGAWFLRPQVSDPPRPTAEPAVPGRGPRGGGLTRKGWFFIATFVGGGFLVSAEALSLLWLGKGALWPDVALVTILVMAVAMLCEMLFVK